jgi:hypothetical protein
MTRVEVTVEGGRLVLDKKLLKATLRAAGNEVAGVARALVRKTAGSGRVRRGHRASAPGQPPASLSGKLAASIRVRMFKNGEGVSIRATEFYAKMLETGARSGGGNTRKKANILLAGETNWRGRVLRSQNRMKTGAINQARVLAPRPFMTVALAAREGSIAARVKESIDSGMKFQKFPKAKVKP